MDAGLPRCLRRVAWVVERWGGGPRRALKKKGCWASELECLFKKFSRWRGWNVCRCGVFRPIHRKKCVLGANARNATRPSCLVTNAVQPGLQLYLNKMVDAIVCDVLSRRCVCVMMYIAIKTDIAIKTFLLLLFLAL